MTAIHSSQPDASRFGAHAPRANARGSKTTKQSNRTMTDFVQNYLANRQRLIDGHAYNPEDEHSACGVGLVAALDGQPRREIVEMGIKALKNVWHRGAVDADGKTGDGAGIRVEVPQEFFRYQVSRCGHNPTDDPICVGQIFLPRTDL